MRRPDISLRIALIYTQCGISATYGALALQFALVTVEWSSLLARDFQLLLEQVSSKL